MQKLILDSILAIAIVLPAIAAAEPDPGRGLKKLMLWTVAGVAAYVFGLLFVYPRFLG